MMKGTVLAGLLVAALAACGKRPAELPSEPTLVFDSRVEFVAEDGKTPRTAPRHALRIWAPMLVGDLYGSPNEGEPVPIVLKRDLTFRLDLNGAAQVIEKGLVPTRFSQKWMAIEPADARVARLMPYVLEADGIAPAGTAEWLDRASGARLMLIYVDRPARIRGDIVYEERRLQFEIDAAQAGFLWVRQPEGNGTFRSTPAPAPGNLVLAVHP